MADERPAEVRIPVGLGPGDVPDRFPWPRSLWLILPASPTKSQSDSINTLRVKIKALEDLSISEVKVRNTRGVGGLEFPLIPAKDVAGLYRRAHRARTAVIAFGAARVLLDISELPSTKGCVPLERFIRYKCSYSLVTRPGEVNGTLARALAWMNDIHCEGPHDPRCFPTAIFETREQYPLNTHEERRAFVKLHRESRRSSALTDARGRTWQIGPEHTLDLLQVGGRTLPIGFHWDVQARHDSVIVTGWERWELRGRGYTNIHPDALIRGGNAAKTHPTTSEKEKPRSPKTPRSSRRSKSR
jgi:hypothetical protein